MSPIQLIPFAANILVPAAEHALRGVAERLSFAKELGAASLPQLTSLPTGAPSSGLPGGVDSLQPRSNRHLQQLADSELSKFLGRLREVLATQDIDPSIPFEVTAGPSGRLVVDGNHPQRSTIEESIREDEELNSVFRRLAGAVSSVRDADFRDDRFGSDLRILWERDGQASLRTD